MKNYRDSDYAVNKFAKGIVYHFADQTLEVTLTDYLNENPQKKEADFTELKALSDEMFLEQVRSDNAISQKTVSFTALENTAICAVPSAEILIVQAERKTERENIALAVLDKLTEVQRRRYILHNAKGLTMREIGEMEGVAHPSVVESLLAAEKKISKFLKSG